MPSSSSASVKHPQTVWCYCPRTPWAFCRNTTSQSRRTASGQPRTSPSSDVERPAAGRTWASSSKRLHSLISLGHPISPPGRMSPDFMSDRVTIGQEAMWLFKAVSWHDPVRGVRLILRVRGALLITPTAAALSRIQVDGRGNHAGLEPDALVARSLPCGTPPIVHPHQRKTDTLRSVLRVSRRFLGLLRTCWATSRGLALRTRLTSKMAFAGSGRCPN